MRFTAHLLEGPSALWWETYQVTHPLEDLTWDAFKEGFRNAHISSSIMNLKKEEFRSLRQGSRTLKEYMDDFCTLSRYAPKDIDTDAKRKEKFLNGLKGELKIPLYVAYAPNYQALLDQAITLDNNIRKEENRKRNFSTSKFHSEGTHKSHHVTKRSGHKAWNHSNNGSGQKYHGHNHNGEYKGNNGGYKGNNGGIKGNHHHGHNHGNGHHRPNYEGKKDLSNVTCFKCKKT